MTQTSWLLAIREDPSEAQMQLQPLLHCLPAHFQGWHWHADPRNACLPVMEAHRLSFRAASLSGPKQLTPSLMIRLSDEFVGLTIPLEL